MRAPVLCITADVKIQGGTGAQEHDEAVRAWSNFTPTTAGGSGCVRPWRSILQIVFRDPAMWVAPSAVFGAVAPPGESALMSWHWWSALVGLSGECIPFFPCIAPFSALQPEVLLLPSRTVSFLCTQSHRLPVFVSLLTTSAACSLSSRAQP